MDTKQVYDKIATHFDKTRISIWLCVRKFLDSFQSNDKVLDVGCGNGKNMLYRSDLNVIGIDLSSELVSICHQKGLKVIEGSMVKLPFANESFDGVMAIASYHHLDNDNDRELALKEFYRVIKKGGRIMIQVWAVEQPKNSRFKFKEGDNFVPWLDKTTNQNINRYYNIYPANKLGEEINRLCTEFIIKEEYWEKGNWIIILSK